MTLELQDAINLLKQLVAPCDNKNEHSWRKCKRCLAIYGLEYRFDLSAKLIQIAIDKLELNDRT